MKRADFVRQLAAQLFRDARHPLTHAGLLNAQGIEHTEDEDAETAIDEATALADALERADIPFDSPLAPTSVRIPVHGSGP